MKNSFANIPGLKNWINYLICIKYKIKSKKLIFGYNNKLRNSIFKGYNALGDNVKITNSSIGKYTYISNNTEINNSIIGKFCSVGPSVKIGIGIHPFNEFISSHPLFYSSRNQIGFSILDKSKFVEYENVFIGNDVWIGANVVILDGITIGDGAVVAAGSVVTKNVNPYSLVAGVPAIHKKFKFSNEKINEIMSNPWWNKDFEQIKKMIVK